MALAESAPGLRIGKDSESLRLVQRKDRLAIFMPGIHFPNLTNGDFVPAWHDAVSQDGDTSSEARWAIVFFANAYRLRLPTFEEAHTPKNQ